MSHSSSRRGARIRFGLVVGIVLGLMAFGLTASADDVVYDGDGDTPVAVNSATMELGNVCAGGTEVNTMPVAIKRFWQDADGPNDPGRVFMNSANLTMSIPSAITGSHASSVSATLTDSAIVLPSDWLDTTAYPKSTVYEGDMAELEVTVNVPATPGYGVANIPLRATGRNSNDTATIFRSVTSKVDWTAVACDPVVTINLVDPNPVKPADTTFDVDWQADQTGTYSIRVGGTDCTDGTEVASGNYTTANTEVTDTLNATDLAYGENTLRVCVTSTSGEGYDEETVYRQAPTTLTYTGPTTVVAPAAVPMKGTLADSTTGCDVRDQNIEFYIDLNDDGDYGDIGEDVGDDNTATGSPATGDSATTPVVNSPVLQPGIYLAKLTFAGTPECAPAQTEFVLSLVNPDDAANGGGWYQIAGQTGSAKSVNYGFTTRWDRRASAYRGEVLVDNKTAWRMKGDILGFAKTSAGTTFPKKGEATGTALLQCWNSTTGGWKTADEEVTFKLAFTDTGTPNKKTGAVKPDTFTVKYVTSYTPQNSCPSAVSPLVQSTEQQLKGGNILVK